MAKMFGECEDENGVAYSSNAHNEREYEPRVSDLTPDSPRYNWTPEGYKEDTTQRPLTRRTMDRVYNRPGAMQFEGDLLPRADRIAGKNKEK